MRESAAASHIRLDGARQNTQLWRNNVGAFKDENDRWIRYGLCNESAQQNKILKSSDLIGVTPTMITHEMVGHIIGVFTAVETKASDWRMIPSDKRAIAQAAFHNLVLQAGGYAGFARTVEEYRRIIRR